MGFNLDNFFCGMPDEGGDTGFIHRNPQCVDDVLAPAHPPSNAYTGWIDSYWYDDVLHQKDDAGTIRGYLSMVAPGGTSGRVPFFDGAYSFDDDDGFKFSTGAGLVVNDGGVAAIDFRAESDNLTHALFVDSSADAVLVGTSTPVTGALLTVNGRLSTVSSATYAALLIGSVAGDPSTLVDGDIWYNSTTAKFRAREAGVSLNVITRWARIYKAADETVTTSTTVQSDDELVGTLTAGIKYKFRWHLLVTNTGNGGFRVTINGAATVTDLNASVTMFSNGNVVAASEITALGTEIVGTIQATGYCIIEGTVDCNAGGSFDLQWAQETSDGSTVVTLGSDVEFIRFE